MSDTNEEFRTKTLNEIAADWWVERCEQPDKAEDLRKALMNVLPKTGDWMTYNDYDPQGLLLEAVRMFIPCRGSMFSGDGLFPRKTGLQCYNNVLLGKDGYGAPWILVFMTKEKKHA